MKQQEVFNFTLSENSKLPVLIFLDAKSLDNNRMSCIYHRLAKISVDDILTLICLEISAMYQEAAEVSIFDTNKASVSVSTLS